MNDLISLKNSENFKMETPKKKHKEEYIKQSPIKEDNNIIKENDTTKEDDNNLKKEKVEKVEKEEKEEKEKLNEDIIKEEKNAEKLNNYNNEGEKQDNILALKEKQNENTEEIEKNEENEVNEDIEAKEKSIKNKKKKEKKEIEKTYEDNEIEIDLEENSNIQKEKEKIENENSDDEISSHPKNNSSNKTPIKRKRRRNKRKRKRKFMPLKKKNKNKNKKYSFEVEKILDIKVIDGTKFYKCKWVGYPTKESSYEPITSFEDPNIINVLLKDYNKTIKDKDSNKKSLSEKNKNNQLKQVYMLENNNKNEKIGNNIKIPNLDDVKKINEKYNNLDKNFINSIIKGDIEKDIPKKFITVLQNNEDPTSLFIEIEWKKRKNGIKPGNSTYTNKKIREKFPLLLLDYYENVNLLQHKREKEFAEKIEKDFI